MDIKVILNKHILDDLLKHMLLNFIFNLALNSWLYFFLLELLKLLVFLVILFKFLLI